MKEKSTNYKLFFRLIIISVLVVLTRFSADAQSERRHIREGNRLYNKEEFDQSELSYRRALEKDELSPGARFNLGNSLYKQERFDEAARYFNDLSNDIEDPLNRAKIFHNLGNSLLRSENIEESIEAYKEALRNNHLDDETRYNLAYAQSLLDENEQNDSENGDQDQNDDGENGDDQDQNDDGEGDQNHSDNENSSNEGDSNQDQSQAQANSITPEEALRMLEAAERDELRVQEKIADQKELQQQQQQQTRSGRVW